MESKGHEGKNALKRESIPDVGVWLVVVGEVRAMCSVKEAGVPMCREKASLAAGKGKEAGSTCSCCEMRVSRLLSPPTIKSPK